MTVQSVLMSISERRISTYKRGFNTENEAECLGLYNGIKGSAPLSFLYYNF